MFLEHTKLVYTHGLEFSVYMPGMLFWLSLCHSCLISNVISTERPKMNNLSKVPPFLLPHSAVNLYYIFRFYFIICFIILNIKIYLFIIYFPSPSHILTKEKSTQIELFRICKLESKGEPILDFCLGILNCCFYHTVQNLKAKLYTKTEDCKV